MTYHYRIYTFQNGLGETIFRAKRVGWLPPRFTPWIEETVIRFDWPLRDSKWSSRDSVVAAIQKDAQKQYEISRRLKQKQLKLIIVEDESVEIV